MPTIEQWRKDEAEKTGRLLARRRAEHDARHRSMLAKRATACPQCKGAIQPGDVIVHPYEHNAHGGNRFFCWYCETCGNAAHNEAAPGFIGPHLDTLNVRKEG